MALLAEPPCRSSRARAARLGARLLSDRAGVSAVEFALILPALAALLGGLVDASRLIVQTMQVRAAAQAGADYARSHAFDAGLIQSVAQGATSLAVTATVAQFGACVSAGGIAQTTAAVCADGSGVGQFVQVDAQSTYQALMPWPSGVLPATLSAEALVRTQ